MSHPTPLEVAILRTVIYADVFDFALRVEELHHFLMANQAVSLATIQEALACAPNLRHDLTVRGEWVVLAGREALLDVRQNRDDLAAQLWPKVAQAGQWLASVPFVRMVAVTGALAMDNPAHPQDDFDYFVVTTPGRVWLARLLIVGVVRVSRLWGWAICPNFVIAADSLSQRRRDIYIAHEISQAIPLADHHGVYHEFRLANAWTFEYLPNAQVAFERRTRQMTSRLGAVVQRMGEWLFGGWLGDKLEAWERERKVARFARQAKRPDSAAQLDRSQVKGHFNDHGTRVLAEYHARLRQFGLEEPNADDLAAD